VTDPHRLIWSARPVTTGIPAGSYHRYRAERNATPSQFGKNHLGDKNEFLRRCGFDEFFGYPYPDAMDIRRIPGIPAGVMNVVGAQHDPFICD
jgi:hypothetical protein